MLFNNRAYLPVKSGRQPNIERLQSILRKMKYCRIWIFINFANNISNI